MAAGVRNRRQAISSRKRIIPKTDNFNPLLVFGAGRAAFDWMQAGRRAKSQMAVRLDSEMEAGRSDPDVELACR